MHLQFQWCSGTRQPSAVAMVKQKNSSIFRSICTLLLGNSIGKLIGFLSIPIIAKLYSPDEIGVLSLFTSSVNILVVFSTLKYCLAIPLERIKINTIAFVYLCLAINMIVSLITFTIALFFHSFIMNYLSIPNLVNYWPYIILSSFLIGVYETLENWNVQKRNFKAISQTKISQSVFGNLSKIIFGLLNFKIPGLLFGQIISQSGGIIPLAKDLPLRVKFFRIAIKNKLYLLKEHIDFPLYRLPSQLLLTFSLYFPIFFFNYSYGENITGQLSMAFISLAIPISLIGQSISQVYYAEIAKITRNAPKKILELTNSIIIKLFLLSIPPTIILYLFGENLFLLFFGQEWEIAGKLIETLSISILFQFISSPLVNIFTVFSRQKELIFINLIRTILLILSFYLSYNYKLNYIQCTLVYTLVISINYVYTIARIYTVLRKEIKENKNVI